ncbi:MAG: hypothetical protein RL689_446, partial [Planctomycetota bacterium]
MSQHPMTSVGRFLAAVLAAS